MVSTYLFLCYSNFNTGKCISVPYQISENTDYFILAQHLYGRFEGELSFSEILRTIEDPIIGRNVYKDSFGWDSTFCTLYIENSCDVLRMKWFPIHSANQIYIPISYIKINGEINYSDENPMCEKSVKDDAISTIQAMLYKEHADKNASSNSNFDFARCRIDLNHLFNSYDEFEYEGISIVHNLKFETIKDLRDADAKYHFL